MDKKNIAEIRRQFSMNNCTATKICGCYVDHEKNKKFESKSSFLMLPEEEEFKYFDIFKHTLSGSLGRNLINFEFPLQQESEGGTQEFLYKLLKCGLDDEELVSQFYDRIIDNYEYAENYYIVLTYFVYDVPMRTSDNNLLEDASDEVYSYILCSICPVKMTKAGLSYNQENNRMEERTRDWVVEMPLTGFLFPAFNDRSTDLHSMLYYKKKPEENQEKLVKNVFGSVEPMSPKTQQNTFNELLEAVMGDGVDYKTAAAVYENISLAVEENTADSETVSFSQKEVQKILEASGVPNEKISSFGDCYHEIVGEDMTLQATNMTNLKKFVAKTPHVHIQVDAEYAGQLQEKIVDGQRCLVVPIEDYLEINDLVVKIQ